MAADRSPRAEPTEWTPDQKLRADATDDEIQMRMAWHHLNGANDGPKAADAVMLILHEYAAARVEEAREEVREEMQLQMDDMYSADAYADSWSAGYEAGRESVDE